MATHTKPLTFTEIKAAKPKTKKYRLFDGGGLYIEITPSASKLWRFKYRFEGKEKLLSFGKFPDLSLQDARLKREETRKKIANGFDPSEEKKQEKIKREAKKADEERKAFTFDELSKKYFKHRISREDAPSEKYMDKLQKRVEKHCYPIIKEKPIDEITRQDVEKIIERLKDAEFYEVARRVLQITKAILDHGVMKYDLSSNVAAILKPREEIGKKTVRHFPIITDKEELKGLLIAIDGYTGDYSTKQALRVMPYLAFRPGNIRALEWSEINLENRVVTIPGSKMKSKREYRSPIPKQVLKILEETKTYSGGGRYVFPSYIHKDRPLSENTLNLGLRRLGYTRDQLVSHSFRRIFSTIAHSNLKDHGNSSLAIESQLAHRDLNEIRDTYNESDFYEERIGLMQWWSDFLDDVKKAKK